MRLSKTLATGAAAVLLAAATAPLNAQLTTIPPGGRADSGSAISEDPRTAGLRAQARFENFRRMNLPGHRGSGSSSCQEQVGRFCYWYDEKSPPPPDELPSVTAERVRLIATLDSLGKLNPADRWLAGQRIRYLDEIGLNTQALQVARDCQVAGWWCTALEGFALHQLGRYAEAERAFDSMLGMMSPAEACDWRNISLYMDEDTRRQYRRNECGTEERLAYESRVWWFARTRYGMAGNDSRTEHFARLVYTEFLRGAPSAYMFGFDLDERELVLRFGWARSFSRGPEIRVPYGATYDGPRFQVIGHDPTPAYRYIPPHYVLTSPTVSDSVDWAVQLPPVVARYQPPYAKQILMLEHQKGLFRRGDTALVVLAYDVSKVPEMAGAALEGALVLTPGGVPTPNATIQESVPSKGTLTVRAPWGPLLMSAEIAAPSASILARARYGIRPPYAQGARVVLSDLLFYTPYGEFPTSAEEALPHALATQKVRSSQPLGVFWEAYNTNPAGERMTISLTVVPETEETGALRRGLRALRLAREAQPVSITVEDVSARGSSRSARAVQLDISTLTEGEYLVQLEISVAGQYTIRADRRIVVTGS